MKKEEKKGKQSELRLIKRCTGFIPKEKISMLPRYLRGIYVLFNQDKKHKEIFDVVYVGMARRKMRDRVDSHSKSSKKSKLWTHFSVFEVWDNIRDEEIAELEGLLRHIYRRDSRANMINKQKRFQKIYKVKNNNLKNWKSYYWAKGNLFELKK